MQAQIRLEKHEVERFMELAIAMAQARAAHEVAVVEFSHDRGEFSEVETSAAKYRACREDLREALEK